MWAKLCCSPLNISVARSEDDDVMMSKEQLTLSLSQLLKSWFLSPMTFKDPNSLQTVKPPPLLPAWMPTEAHVDAFSQGTNRPEDLQYCLSNLLKRSVWSVCLIDHPTTIALPEIAVRDYLFGEPHLFFFFKWPYLSLKKNETLGDKWGWECFLFVF